MLPSPVATPSWCPISRACAIVLERLVEVALVTVDASDPVQVARQAPSVSGFACYRERFLVVLKRIVEVAFVMADFSDVGQLGRHAPLVADVA
jgi:hypothetical protein